MNKTLTFKVEWFRHKWPIFAVGFLGGEFVLSLWVVDFRIAWGY